MEDILSSKILKSMMKNRGYTQIDMARLLGVKSQTNVSEYVKRDMKYSLLLRFLEVMDYDLEFIDKKNNDRLDHDGELMIGHIINNQSSKAKWMTGRELKVIQPDNGDLLNSIIYCSNCMSEAIRDSKYGQQLTDYCPCCGASMREEE